MTTCGLPEYQLCYRVRPYFSEQEAGGTAATINAARIIKTTVTIRIHILSLSKPFLLGCRLSW